MIKIGLTGFGDHEELYGKIKPADRLPTYSAHFPIVEIDSAFYAVQPAKNYAKWAAQTPEDFRFIVKAYQGMTGHLRGTKNVYDTQEEMYRAFHDSIGPLQAAGKLAMVLFQFPPWFDCTRANVDVLRETKKRMGDVPSAIEFRNQSWYTDDMRGRTLKFLTEEDWIHTVADEPQAGSGSIPIVAAATRPDLTCVRLHGRNTANWNQSNDPNWRNLRYLYRYSTGELEAWRDLLLELEKSCRELYVVFNNNSGGDATDNAKELMSLLGIEGGPGPLQLDLF